MIFRKTLFGVQILVAKKKKMGGDSQNNSQTISCISPTTYLHSYFIIHDMKLLKKLPVQKAKGNGTPQFLAPNQWTHIPKSLIQSGWMMEKMKEKKVTVKTVKMRKRAVKKWPAYILFSYQGICDPR